MSVQGGLWCSYDFLSAFLSVTKRQMSVAVLNLRIYFSFEDLNCFEYLIYFFWYGKGGNLLKNMYVRLPRGEGIESLNLLSVLQLWN